MPQQQNNGSSNPEISKFQATQSSPSLSSLFCMGSFSFFFFFVSFTTVLLSSSLLFQPSYSGPLSSEFISPNFTASYFRFIDTSGAFLSSPNDTFKAAIASVKPEEKLYYFLVLHSTSKTIVWIANRNSPISDSAEVHLSAAGLEIVDDLGKLIWKTTPFNSSVALLQLREDGNLVLLDRFNGSLWQSFEHPTDTLVIGQKLLVGHSLVGASNKSDGDYRLTVNDDDAMMQWNGMTYWKLSMSTTAIRDSNQPVSFLTVTETGVNLSAGNGSVLVIRMVLAENQFRIAKLEPDGRFVVKSFVGGNQELVEFTGPNDACRIPFICKKIGLCENSRCSCPPGFHSDPKTNGDCTPTDSSLTLPGACNASGNGALLNSSFSYIKLGADMGYFANDFTEPTRNNVNLSVCEDLCSRNCSCLGIFHASSSGSCYLLQNYLGSVMSRSSGESDRLGYIKALVVFSPENPDGNSDDGKSKFPVIGLVLLPFSGFFLILVCGGIFLLRRKSLSRKAGVNLGRENSSSSAELEIISVPGLPVRFDYAELVVATDNFSTHIGSGGFGIVYKGNLPDESVVAVKKITYLGARERKEFYTEIAIIGKIHHVNLVGLKGFCAQRRQRFLVYEYMNRGSLDRSLFGTGPVLEWQERFEIALGTARGLAYLHRGCEQKIIHCDIKPENILLHGNLQVKISDFGLSKLLSPEQSSLFTTMRGTRGYLAPEWLTSSGISDKTDVYSYGMVLLEIVRGRKNCSFQTHSHSLENSSSEGPSSSSSPSGQRLVYFPLFALEMHEQRRYVELADPKLEGRVTTQEVERLVRVALCCLHEEPMLRPSMSSVVGMLEGGLPLGNPLVESLNFLRFYGRRFTEASTIEGDGEQNELVFYPQAGAASDSATSGSPNSFSYISSQQISGPR